MLSCRLESTITCPAWRRTFATSRRFAREERARRLLKEAGFGPGHPLPVEIRYNTSENNKATAIAIGEMWKPLGVETTFVNTDVKTHFGLLQSGGDFDVARAGWIGDYSDPQNFLFLFESANARLNYARWSNAAYDRLMTEAAGETDLKARAATLAEAERLLLEEEPVIPLLFYESKTMVSRRVKGWRDNLLDRHLARWLSIEPAEASRGAEGQAKSPTSRRRSPASPTR